MKPKPILPPRKKDWKPGKTQIGLFIRTEGGDTIELTLHDANASIRTHAAKILLEVLEIQADANPPGATRYQRKDPLRA